VPRGDWKCTWPSQADDEQIDTQSVVIRVRVDTTGAPLAAEVVDDPGSGFGAAASACALRRQYGPAHDRDGECMAAVSPPIEITFKR
jgi:protein TonB